MNQEFTAEFIKKESDRIYNEILSGKISFPTLESLDAELAAGKITKDEHYL